MTTDTVMNRPAKHLRGVGRTAVMLLLLASFGLTACGEEPPIESARLENQESPGANQQTGSEETVSSTPHSEPSAEEPEGKAGVSGEAALNGDFHVAFVLSSDGSYRFESERGTTAYDASTFRLESDIVDLGTIVVEGLPPSGPDIQHAHLLAYLQVGTMPWLYEARAQGLVTEEDGTSNWTGEYHGERGVSSVSVRADSSIGLPIEVDLVRLHDGSHSTLEVVLDTPGGGSTFDATLFTLGLDASTATHAKDRGFRLITLDQAEELAGYAPPLPDWLPEGFALTSVAYADEPDSDVTLIAPPSEKVLVLTYRNGFRTLTITTRLKTIGYLREATGEQYPWSDPYCIGPPCDPVATVAAAGGDFDIVAAPLVVTHAWAVTGDTVVTVGGDVSVNELQRILLSME